MKKLILLLIFFSAPVIAEEPITGAFGMTLGEVADGVLRDRLTHDGYVSYRFKPKTPVEPFDYYKVHVTPVKGLVFLIQADQDVRGGCTASLNALKKALDRKYGASVIPETSDGTRRANWRRDRGEENFRSISLSCSYSSNL